MSVSLYRYDPKYCEGEPCIGDCDLCREWEDFEEYETELEKIDAIGSTLASDGTPHGTGVSRKVKDKGTQWERWEFVHRATWEEHNGPIPENGMIIFKDGDKMNRDISNLMLITNRENAVLNRWKLRSEDPDLLETGVNVARLKIAVKDAKKRKKK